MHWFFWVVFVVFCLRTFYQVSFAAGATPKPAGAGTYALAAIISTLLAVGTLYFGYQFS